MHPLADAAGNTVLVGNRALDQDLAMCAGRVIVTAERVVAAGELEGELELSSQLVDAVVECPGGAWPTSCYPNYPVDTDAVMDYVEACDRGEFEPVPGTAPGGGQAGSIVRYSVAPEIFEVFPGYVRGVVVARGCHNSSESPVVLSLLRGAEAAVRGDPRWDAAAAVPRIAAWRSAFGRFGATPSKFPSSVEAILKRAHKGDTLPYINDLVARGHVPDPRPCPAHRRPRPGPGATATCCSPSPGVTSRSCRWVAPRRSIRSLARSSIAMPPRCCAGGGSGARQTRTR